MRNISYRWIGFVSTSRNIWKKQCSSSSKKIMGLQQGLSYGKMKIIQASWYSLLQGQQKKSLVSVHGASDLCVRSYSLLIFHIKLLDQLEFCRAVFQMTFFTQGYERLPNLCSLSQPPYFVYGKFGLVPSPGWTFLIWASLVPITAYHVFRWLANKDYPQKKHVTAPILKPTYDQKPDTFFFLFLPNKTFIAKKGQFMLV